MDIKATMVSPFCENVADVLDRLTITETSLRSLAYEFCAAFDLKIDGQRITQKVLSLSTLNGYPAGFISTGSMYARRSSESELTYVYDNEFLIRKERSSGKTGRHQRDSTKIATLIRTLRKQDEAPTEANITDKLMMREAKAVLSPLYNSKRSYIQFQLDQDDVVSMTETILGVPNTGKYLDKNSLQVEYNKYMAKIKESGSASLNIKRYERGMTLVGMYYEKGGYSENPLTCYFITDATIEDKNLVLQSPLKRYADLSSLPELSVTAMMIRTYMQGGGAVPVNAFGIGMVDKYFDDLDITTGYRDNKFMWVAIPKEIPNA
jgi:hypothetical protein